MGRWLCVRETSFLVVSSLLILSFFYDEIIVGVLCKKSSSYSSSHGRRSSSRSSISSGRQSDSRKSRPSKPRYEKFEEEEDYDEEEEEELSSLNFLDEDDGSEERRPRSKSLKSNRSPSRPSQQRNRVPPPRRSAPRYEEDDYYDDEEDDYRRSYHSSKRSSRRGQLPSRRSGNRRRNSRSEVVPYVGRAAGTFTRGLAAVRESIPSASVIQETATNAILTAKESTSKLSSNFYREIKGLTSSELEQVMLKATRPDDTPVKSKHVERLVGVTYQISGRYDIYDSVLRKLWNKLAELDWRTKIKALYILHRFSADGAPDHQAALKARLRELRRAQDPKRRGKYFNSKQLLSGPATPETQPYRAFLARYAHYVLLRAQCFSGMFQEISSPPSKKNKKTSSPLRMEHLEASKMLLKAACACSFKDGEECENIAIAIERVAIDLMGLTSAVATALNRVLKSDSTSNNVELKRWCQFYSEELRPETKAFVKKVSPKLDKYGLFLPSRIGVSVPQDLLKKGLQIQEKEVQEEDNESKNPNEKNEDDESKQQQSLPEAGKEGDEKEEEEEEGETRNEEEEEEEEQEEEEEDQEEEEVEVSLEDEEYEEEYEYDDEEYY